MFWYSEIRQGYGGALEQWCDGVMDPLDAIPEHLHRSTCILGFLLAKPVPVKRPRDLDDKIRLFDMVQSDHHNISLRSFPTAGELLRANVSTEVRSPKFSLLAN
jgi:hypothetical protein